MESRSNFYEEVLLGGLLHDIGKFIQKSFILYSGKGQHPQISKDFLKEYESYIAKRFDSEVILEIVQKHYSNPKYFKDELNVKNAKENILPFAYIVCESDNLSSKERDTDYMKSNFRTRAMDTPFYNLKLTNTNTNIMQYVPNVYEAENCFPKKQPEFDVSIINKYVANFNNDFKQIMASIKDNTPFEKIYDSIYNVLKRYLWCIPSDTQHKIADISLFDHSKTTSAIAACMYKYHKDLNDFSIKSITSKEQNKFLVFAAELSGLEKYAISVTDNLNAQGVSKRLKARIFKMQTMLDVISMQIIEKLELPISNIIIDNGRKIYILLPNTKETIEYIESLNNTIQNELYNQYYSKIQFNYDYIKIAGKDFDNFGETFEKLNISLEYKKLKPFYSALVENNSWKQNFSFDVPLGSSICKGCGCEFSQSNNDLGSECMNDMKIGSALANIKAYEIVKGEKADIQFWNQWGINIITDIKNISDDKFTYVLDFDNSYYTKNVCFKNISNYVPKNDNGNVKTFDEIAENIKSIKRFGYLKMDIDNMNLIFSDGFNRDNDSSDTSISRISTISRMMTIFFRGYVDKLVKDKYDLCYIIYSNDDDLIILGPWNLILDLSIELNDNLKKFVGGNPDINFSAAIEFSHINTPISHMISRLNEQLNKSKSWGNSVTIFSQTITFDDLKYLKDEATKLYNDDSLTSGDLWKLKKYGEMIKEKNLRYKMLIAYDIGRRKQNRNQKNYIDWIEPVLNEKDSKKSKLLESIADLTFMYKR